MRVLVAALLLAAGLASGVATVALHALGWGLALAVAAVAVTLYALPAGWWSRLPFALGWVGMVGWLVAPRPEGDYAIGSDLAGYTLIAVALVVLVLALVTLPRPGSARRVPR